MILRFFKNCHQFPYKYLLHWELNKIKMYMVKGQRKIDLHIHNYIRYITYSRNKL